MKDRNYFACVIVVRGLLGLQIQSLLFLFQREYLSVCVSTRLSLDLYY